MIDVKNTIIETIKDKLQKMRFLGQYDPITFKHILYLIVLDDIYDWSSYLDENQAIQKRLQELRTQFILNHGEFIIQTTSPNHFYVNTNTPQTNDTWKRVWDAPDVKIIESVSQIVPERKPWTPDPTCPVSIVYFEGEDAPTIDVSTLTTCEKMNIYINRDNNTIWYLDQNCVWKQVAIQPSWSLADVLEYVKNTLKIKHDQNALYQGIFAELSETDNTPIVFCSNEEVEDLV